MQYDEQLNDIVSSIENDICGTSQSSASYLVRYFSSYITELYLPVELVISYRVANSIFFHDAPFLT